MTSTDSIAAAAASRIRHRRRRQRHQGRNRRLGHRAVDRRPVQAADPATRHAVGRCQDHRQGRQRIRLDRSARGDLSRRRHPRHRPDGGQRGQAWIGTNARDIIGAELDGQEVTVLNDADAAGLAEERYGAGKGNSGLVVLLTFGTGIGSAVIHNGKLIPNTEFGHLEVGGKEAEQRAASSVKEKNDWSYEKWAKEVTRVLVAIENAMWPDLFIAGGGISRKADKWVPLLENRTPVVPAALLNTAGIVGAAMASTADVTH